MGRPLGEVGAEELEGPVHEVEAHGAGPKAARWPPQRAASEEDRHHRAAELDPAAKVAVLDEVEEVALQAQEDRLRAATEKGRGT